jgi:hypothetical protein
MRMIRLWASATCVAAALAFGGAQLTAQGKPANATAQCKDGTYSTAKTRQGACSRHGGVQTWYADSAKSDIKVAGKETKEAAKDVGKATENGAKAVGKETKEVTKSAAKAIKGKPSDAPSDATAKCKDGTYSHAKQHRGACSSHGGVAEWYK